MREHAQGSSEIYNVMLELEALGIAAELHRGFMGEWCMWGGQGNGACEFELCIPIS